MVLVTADNLHEYIIKDYPLHKAYNYLSSVHKADYLRCYFMHLYGGGYSDIKTTRHTWINLFNRIKNDNNIWIVGYKETGEKSVPFIKNNEELTRELKNNWTKLIGNASYICKPMTPFTTEWFNSVNTLLDNIYDDLVKYPARHHRDCNCDGKTNGYLYPLQWSELLAQIFHPLCLKYNNHILASLRPLLLYNYV